MSHRASLTLLQAVDVLRVHAQQQAFVVEHADEVVDVVGPVASRIQSLSQGEERQRVVGEEVDVEDGLWVGNIVLLQVGIQARSWSPEQRRNNESDKNAPTEKEKHNNANLKSGIPLAVLIPAPATTTTFLQRPSFTSRATDASPPRDLPRVDLEPEDRQACAGTLLLALENIPWQEVSVVHGSGLMCQRRRDF